MRSILVGQLQKKSPRQAKMRFQTICFVRNDFAHTCSHGITCCCEYISMVHTYCIDKWCTVLVAGCRRSPAGRCQVARSPAVASGRQRSPGRQVARSPVGRQVASGRQSVSAASGNRRSPVVTSGRQVASQSSSNALRAPPANALRALASLACALRAPAPEFA